MKGGLWQFCSGTLVGILLTSFALLGQSGPSSTEIASVTAWLQLNLGHSVWLFAAVALIFTVTLSRLQKLLSIAAEQPAEASQIAALDQMLDVWTQVFIGIGVVWTAVGMRAALQYALGEPDAALADSADNVLRKLVDGGILLALTTTIVGAVGGYLMRLCKSIISGPALQQYYDQLERQDIAQLLAATQRIERQLKPAPAADQNVTQIPGTRI